MQYAQDPYADIPVDVPIDRQVDGPVEGVMKVKGKGKQSKVKVNSHEVMWCALLIQATNTSDLSDDVVVVQKHKADDDVNPGK